MSPSAVPRTFLALAAGVILVSIFLRFHQLEHVPGISGDEAAVAVLLMGHVTGDPVRVREGTENLFNPIHHGLVFLIHTVADPDPFILRLPPLLFGISCVVLSFVLFRRVLGYEGAVIAALFMSTLPLHVAYSRLSQSPSLTPLISLICLYFAIRGAWIRTLLACLLAIWVHPTNVFLAPVLIAPFADPLLRRWRGLDAAARLRALGLAALAVTAVAITVGTGVLLVSPRSTSYASILRGDMLVRLSDAPQFARFINLYGNLLSGTTIYEYFVGNDPSRHAHVTVFWTVFIPVMMLGSARLWQTGATRWLLMMGGLLASLSCFYVVAGPLAISPHYERWATFLTMPSCLLFAVALGSLRRGTRSTAVVRLLSLGVSIAFLVSFHAHYFLGMHSGVGQHRAYRTGAVDPKQQAVSAIEEIRDRKKRTVVVAEDWWIYWPMRYFAYNYDGYFVALNNPGEYPGFAAEFKVPDFPLTEAEVFRVVFAGSSLDAALAQLAGTERVQALFGYTEAPILRIYRDRRG
jgi:hypothetical protein